MKRCYKQLSAALILALFALAVMLAPWPGNYASPLLWARNGEIKSPDGDPGVDVFILVSTCDMGTDGTFQSSVWKQEDRTRMSSRISLQTALYGDWCRTYAPYYSQACLSVYDLDDPDRGPYFRVAYRDVRKAFLWYLEHENNGRPFILAGYSQGADLSLRLLEEFGETDAVKNQMIAAYLIGWRVTDRDLDEFTFLKMAEGEDDTGVIVSFCSEADYITNSIIVPEGCYTYGINPLNWKTDDTLATKEENPGSQYYHGDGTPSSYWEQLTGCYRDQTRGVIVPTDITAEDHPPLQPLFCEGCFHNYDLCLYYKSVHDNVKTRIDAYMASHFAK